MFFQTASSYLRDNQLNLPQQALYFLPLPHGHGSLRPTFASVRRTVFGLLIIACQ